jgi:hypothetical protein
MLEAIIPDLKRRVANFDFSTTIKMQYLVSMDTTAFKWLDAIPYGSTADLQWMVSPGPSF